MSQEVMSLDKAKMHLYEEKQLAMQQEVISNNLREAFGYSPRLTAKQANYRMTKMPVQVQYQDLDDHVLKKDNQYQPLQRLLQEEKERVMVMEKGIDTAETTRFFIEKINEYNSILDLDHIKHNKKNFDSLQKYVQATPGDTNQMKRYTGDHGQVTNFHFVLNWQNLMPVFRELSESKPSTPKAKRIVNAVRKAPPAKKKVAAVKKPVVSKLELMFKDIDERNQLSATVALAEEPVEDLTERKEASDIVDTNRAKQSTKSIITPKQTSSNLSQYMTNVNTPFTSIKRRTFKAHSERSTNRPNTTTQHTNKTTKQHFHPLEYRIENLVDERGTQSFYEADESKHKLITKMIDSHFDESLIVQYLTNHDLQMQSNLKSVPKRIVNNIQPVDELQLRAIEEQMSQFLSNQPTELTNAFKPKAYSARQTEPQQSVTVPVKPDTPIDVVVLPPTSPRIKTPPPPRELPPLSNVVVSDSPAVRQLRRRKRIISELIGRKQPKFVHIGGTKFAVLNTSENVNFYARMKQESVDARLRLQNDRLRQQALLDEEQMQSNLFILSGPPKKLKFESTDLKHDYHDMKVSKMMKQLNRTKR